jgi:hypothetical protein
VRTRDSGLEPAHDPDREPTRDPAREPAREVTFDPALFVDTDVGSASVDAEDLIEICCPLDGGRELAREEPRVWVGSPPIPPVVGRNFGIFSLCIPDDGRELVDLEFGRVAARERFPSC